MRTLITLQTLLFFLIFNILSAQKHDYNWVFADSVGISFNDSIPIGFETHCSKFYSIGFANRYPTVSDKNGKLLFYVEPSYRDEVRADSHYTIPTTVIKNANGEIIDNGDSILDYSVSTTSYFLPQPDNDSLYYLFTWNHHYRNPINRPSNILLLGGIGRKNSIQQFHYHIINANANNGKGAVISKNNLLAPEFVNYSLVSIKHTNGKDWWLLAHERDSSRKFIKFLLTKNGIQRYGTQEIGSIIDSDGYSEEDKRYVLGLITSGKFQYTKNRLFMVSQSGIINRFDFDRCSGLLSNFKDLSDTVLMKRNNSQIDGYGALGIELSKNEKKLYLLSSSALEVLDLEYDGFKKSTIDSVKFHLGNPEYYSYGVGIELTPTTNEIYITKFRGRGSNFAKTLAVIKYPDEEVDKCGFVYEGFTLPNNHIHCSGFPTFPKYRAPALPTKYYRYDTLICKNKPLSIGKNDTLDTLSRVFRWKTYSGIPLDTGMIFTTTLIQNDTLIRTMHCTTAECLLQVDTFVIEVQNKHSFSSRTDTIICQGSILNLGKDLGESYNYSWSGIKIADSTVSILTHRFDSVGVYKFWRHQFSASQGCTTVVDTYVVEVQNKHFFSTRTDTLICRGSVLNLGKDLGESYNYSWSGIKVVDSTVKILNYKFDSVGVFKFWRHRFSASQGCTTAVDTYVVEVKNKYFFSSRTDTLICRGSVLNLGKDLGKSYDYSWSGIKVADSTVKILSYKFDSVGVYKFWRHRFSASQGCTTAVDTFVVMVKTTAPPCVTALEKHIIPKAKVKIYPNPTKDVFMITSNQRVLRVRLYDINGKKITEYIPDGYPETLTFNVATVPRGIYLCEVDTEGGKITQRVVVER